MYSRRCEQGYSPSSNPAPPPDVQYSAYLTLAGTVAVCCTSRGGGAPRFRNLGYFTSGRDGPGKLRYLRVRPPCFSFTCSSPQTYNSLAHIVGMWTSA